MTRSQHVKIAKLPPVYAIRASKAALVTSALNDSDRAVSPPTALCLEKELAGPLLAPQ